MGNANQLPFVKGIDLNNAREADIYWKHREAAEKLLARIDKIDPRKFVVLAYSRGGDVESKGLAAKRKCSDFIRDFPKVFYRTTGSLHLRIMANYITLVEMNDRPDVNMVEVTGFDPFEDNSDLEMLKRMDALYIKLLEKAGLGKLAEKPKISRLAWIRMNPDLVRKPVRTPSPVPSDSGESDESDESDESNESNESDESDESDKSDDPYDPIEHYHRPKKGQADKPYDIKELTPVKKPDFGAESPGPRGQSPTPAPTPLEAPMLSKYNTKKLMIAAGLAGIVGLSYLYTRRSKSSRKSPGVSGRKLDEPAVSLVRQKRRSRPRVSAGPLGRKSRAGPAGRKSRSRPRASAGPARRKSRDLAKPRRKTH